MNFLIHHFLDFHARRAPEADAIRFLDERLDYRELSLASNQLANCLLDQDVRRGDRVGIYMNKCLQTPIALYGIMKAGAAYVPLDPASPAARTAAVIEDCDIRIIISANNKKRSLAALTDALERELLVIGPDPVAGLHAACMSWDKVFLSHSQHPPAVRVLADDLAYIIYTSGSTGQPKGIMHTHHSGLSFAYWAVAEYGLTARDRLSNHAPLHFDLSIFDYFAGVVAGSCTAIIPEEYTRLPASYSQLLADYGITVLFTVPFALIQLLLRGVLRERKLDGIRWIIFGGEPMPIKHLQALQEALPAARFDNMYGPAEVNGVTHYTVGSLSASDIAIPIGKLSEAAEALVVDNQGRCVAAGDVGELLVRSPTMMQGYWRRPDLNAAAFHVATGSDEISRIFYRTGDLVTCDEKNRFWFRGRLDRQVKIRGYRVELDEIESALVAHDQVEEAAIFAVSGDPAQLEIHGAMRMAQGSNCSEAEIMEYLKGRVAWYALPGKLTIRDEFPRTTSGKIDRRALTMEVAA